MTWNSYTRPLACVLLNDWLSAPKLWTPTFQMHRFIVNFESIKNFLIELIPIPSSAKKVVKRWFLIYFFFDAGSEFLKPARSWRVTLYLRDRSYRDHQIPRSKELKKNTEKFDIIFCLLWALEPVPLRRPCGYAPIIHAGTDFNFKFNNWADPESATPESSRRGAILAHYTI